MTQPAEPQEDGSGQIIATAAITLALITLESRVRQEVEDDITAAFKAIAATAVVAASAAPAPVMTGIALVSMASLHHAITSKLFAARENVAASIEAGYSAAAQLAHTKLAAEFDDNYHVGGTLPELGDNIDRLLTDVDTMFGHAHTDIRDNIIAAYDGITGDDPTAARVVAVKQSLTDSEARLHQRAQAAATVAVHKGANDAQQAIFTQYQTDTHVTGLLKRWVTTSNEPCGMCRALNGTTVGVNADFDAAATTLDKDWRQPWRGMQTPPRHPNCRCQLQLIRA